MVFTRRACPPAATARAAAPRVLRALVMGLSTALAGCGGGVSIGIGIGDDDWRDDPPSVSLVASVAQGTPGQALRLSAAASDDGRVLQVAFYRIEPGGQATLLLVSSREPHVADTTLPGGVASVRYVARATDDGGQSADSAPVDVAVLR